MIQDDKLTLITEDEIYGNNKLDVFMSWGLYGTKSNVTDVVILTGGSTNFSLALNKLDTFGSIWTKSDSNSKVVVLDVEGEKKRFRRRARINI